ncbi:hypothetical protein IGI04_040667, partial [Brassica rapa subsp. trilocularis]
MESDVDLVLWRWSWHFVVLVCPLRCGDQVVHWCDVLVGIDVLSKVLGDVLGEVHGDVPSERWNVEALTQGEFSKNGFIEEVWKYCSRVKTVSS